MKKPTIRVTKWLVDIPIEATCSVCVGVSFRAKGSSHRPNREEYQRSLQAQFEAQFIYVQSQGDSKMAMWLHLCGPATVAACSILANRKPLATGYFASWGAVVAIFLVWWMLRMFVL